MSIGAPILHAGIHPLMRSSTLSLAVAIKAASWAPRRLEHDAIGLNRLRLLTFCLGMIFSENRYPLFRIML